jgi:hypothetical protein
VDRKWFVRIPHKELVELHESQGIQDGRFQGQLEEECCFD